MILSPNRFGKLLIAILTRLLSNLNLFHMPAEKSLVIINEPFENMVLGKNASLSYIAAALELGHEVSIYNVPKTGPVFPESVTENMNVIKIDPNSHFAHNLVVEYKKKNMELKSFMEKATTERSSEILQGYENVKVSAISEISGEELDRGQTTNLAGVTNIIQRIEPMKAPFPPEGKSNLAEFLLKLKNNFPHLSFNCPIYEVDGEPQLLIDKDTPQRMNELLEAAGRPLIATPTREFKFGSDISEQFADMSEEYKSLFPRKDFGKLVLKPKDSAQSLGVFSIEFSNDEQAFDLESLKSTNLQSLKEAQIYKIKPSLDPSELKQITEILCYAESMKLESNKTDFLEKSATPIGLIPEEEITAVAKNLYDNEILVQPFLEGVKSGDIRVNIFKNGDGDFELAGMTYRRSNRHTDDKFTTCLTTGGSSPFTTSILEEAEKERLGENIKIMLGLLNNNPTLREKYQHSSEIGVDFLLQGDGKNVFLGEMNHHCPALAPISEITNAMQSPETPYNSGGLAIAKTAIQGQIAQRKAPQESCRISSTKAHTRESYLGKKSGFR